MLKRKLNLFLARAFLKIRGLLFNKQKFNIRERKIVGFFHTIEEVATFYLTNLNEKYDDDLLR